MRHSWTWFWLSINLNSIHQTWKRIINIKLSKNWRRYSSNSSHLSSFLVDKCTVIVDSTSTSSLTETFSRQYVGSFNQRLPQKMAGCHLTARLSSRSWLKTEHNSILFPLQLSYRIPQLSPNTDRTLTCSGRQSPKHLEPLILRRFHIKWIWPLAATRTNWISKIHRRSQ